MASLLPPNASELERRIEDVQARLGAVAVPIRETWDADTCPAALLPYLAWTLSVDRWDDGWSETIKRAAIRAAVAVHRRKGTRGGLDRALAALQVAKTEILEVWDPGGPTEAYTFFVNAEVQDRGLFAEEWELLADTIEAAKNVRSHLGRLRVVLGLHSRSPVILPITLVGDTTTVYPYAATNIEQADMVPKLAAAVYGVETTTIHPI